MAYYLFNIVGGDRPREAAAGFLRAGMWGVGPDEPHGGALATGDLVLVYVGAPERLFIGSAEVASAVHDWKPAEAQAYPGDATAGVLLARVEAWDPPVPMSTVLSQLPAGKAKADFDVGVVGITVSEYETALAVAAG